MLTFITHAYYYYWSDDLSDDQGDEQLDKGRCVDHFWRAVCSRKSLDGTGPPFSAIPKVVKSGLILAQSNAESERSLSVNVHIVTHCKETLLGERTIVGPRPVKWSRQNADCRLCRPCRPGVKYGVTLTIIEI